MSNGYVVAGYTLIWVSLAWYAWRTERRVRGAERQLRARSRVDGGRADEGE